MRLGCLPYLNVRPLVHYLEQGGLPRGWELVYAPPSQLARMLLLEEIAAAPVSSYAVLANPQLSVCPGICISSDGPVKSVLMFSKVPIPEVRVVALDTSSLSGANMLKIILAEMYDVHPDFRLTAPEKASEALQLSDAVFLIGDTAMLHPKDGLIVLDVGEEWKRLAGLPAVFALWAGVGLSPQLVGILLHSRDEGMRNIESIAREEAIRLELPYEVSYDYLAHTIRYNLGESEMLSLNVFREKCIAHGLLDERTCRNTEILAR
ncbi:MAG: menaquinone biosynthesis protein [Armatimonadota bacterium]|nr:menaquinone biosynthesis protein [Armatimonadota bacterium]